MNKEVRFINACLQDDFETVNELFTKININYHEPFLGTALGCACAANRYTIVKKLLSHPNININTPSQDKTPLEITTLCFHNREKAQRTNTQIFKLLISRTDLNINIINIFICYLANNKEDKIKLLLSRDDYHNKLYDMTYLCQYGKVEHIKRLLILSHKDEDYPHKHEVIEYNKQFLQGYRNISAVNKYLRDPTIVGIWRDSIYYLFAMIVCYTDKYFTVKKSNSNSKKYKKIKSFFQICSGLPIELQMRISHTVFDSTKILIHSSVFTKYAKLLLTTPYYKNIN